MAFNFDTINDSIKDISVIEKDVQGFDLESSIAKCILELNNEIKNKNHLLKKSKTERTLNPKKNHIKAISHNIKSNYSGKKIKQSIFSKEKVEEIKQSILSKEKVEEIKNKILQIFQDNSNVLNQIKQNQYEKDNKLEESLNNARINYEEEIDQIYNDKINKINEINNKYNTDLFELADFVKEEIKDNENKNSSLKQILDSVKKDKQSEIDKINNDFNIKKQKIYEKYYVNIQNYNIKEELISYKNEFANLKTRIMGVLNMKK